LRRWSWIGSDAGARAGLKSVGELAKRPMSKQHDLAAATTRELREASRPIEPRIPPPGLAERRFAEPVARTEYAITVRRTGIQRPGSSSKASGRSAVRYHFSAATGWCARSIRPAADRDPALVIRLMDERIEALLIGQGFG
jgi:protein ImuB